MSELDLNEYDLEMQSEEEPQNPTQIEDLGVQDLGVDELLPAIKTRRVVPKLDAEKLLSVAFGYPLLLKNLQKVRYRGKGTEKRFLKKYVMTYQMWANRVWPKANFQDFILLERAANKDSNVRNFCKGLVRDEMKMKYGNNNESLDIHTNTEPEDEHISEAEDQWDQDRYEYHDRPRNSRISPLDSDSDQEHEPAHESEAANKDNMNSSLNILKDDEQNEQNEQSEQNEQNDSYKPSDATLDEDTSIYESLGF